MLPERIESWLNSSERRWLKPLQTPAVDQAEIRGEYAQWLHSAGHTWRARVLVLEQTLFERGWLEGGEQAELATMRRDVDPGWWALIWRGRRIYGCGESRSSARVRFSYLCPMSWAALTPSEDASVRSCMQCHERVYRCDSVDEAAMHAQAGHCVALPAALASETGQPGARIVVGRPDWNEMLARQIFGEG